MKPTAASWSAQTSSVTAAASLPSPARLQALVAGLEADALARGYSQLQTVVRTITPDLVAHEGLETLLAEHVGSRLHVCHVSTAGSVEIVRLDKGTEFLIRLPPNIGD